jgi:hypothetical protein
MNLEKTTFDQLANQLKTGLPAPACELARNDFFPIVLIENGQPIQTLQTPDEFFAAIHQRITPVPIPERSETRD